jgi:hypothetical protein
LTLIALFGDNSIPVPFKKPVLGLIPTIKINY